MIVSSATARSALPVRVALISTVSTASTTIDTAKMITCTVRTRIGCAPKPKLIALGRCPNGSAGYEYVSAPNRYWITFTSATATPRLDTSVSSGSAPRARSGRKASRSTATPHTAAKSEPPMRARTKGRCSGSAALASSPLKPKLAPVSA